MNIPRTYFFIAAFLIFTSCNKKNEKNQTVTVAGKPPMGWNSFDAYDSRINEEQFKKNVDVI